MTLHGVGGLPAIGRADQVLVGAIRADADGACGQATDAGEQVGFGLIGEVMSLAPTWRVAYWSFSPGESPAASVNIDDNANKRPNGDKS